MKASEICKTVCLREKQDNEINKEAFSVRRPRLTLRKLHRLRLIRDLEKFEVEQHQKFVARMYGGHFEKSDEKENEPDSRTPPKIVKPPKPFKPLEPSSKYLDKYTR